MTVSKIIQTNGIIDFMSLREWNSTFLFPNSTFLVCLCIWKNWLPPSAGLLPWYLDIWGCLLASLSRPQPSIALAWTLGQFNRTWASFFWADCGPRRKPLQHHVGWGDTPQAPGWFPLWIVRDVGRASHPWTRRPTRLLRFRAAILFPDSRLLGFRQSHHDPWWTVEREPVLRDSTEQGSGLR